MANPVYCIVCAGTVHCVPMNKLSPVFQDTPVELVHDLTVDSLSVNAAVLSPATVKIINRNFPYTVNNPLSSDLESDTSRRNSHDSQTPDDDDRSIHTGAPRDAMLKRCHMVGLMSSSSDDESAVSVGSVAARIARDGGANSLSSSNVSPGKSSNINRCGLVSSSLGSCSLLRTKPRHIQLDSAEEIACTSEIDAILNDYSTHAVYLPHYYVDLQTNLDRDYDQIRTLLTKIFPSWTLEIAVTRLTGGITNMLLLGHHAPTGLKLVMRVYGNGTNLIIDRNREFVTHLVLNSLRLAPPIHARFSNGLIYGFVPGRSLEPYELSRPAVFPFVAQQLGHWHLRINCEYIEDGVEKLRQYTARLKRQVPAPLSSPKRYKPRGRCGAQINNVWDLIKDWIRIVPPCQKLVDIIGANLNTHVDSGNVRVVLMREFRWLKNALKKATRSSEVVAHCDLLSGNIIVPADLDMRASVDVTHMPPVEANPVQFIDYEYMMPAPRAFDIANHFAEWQGLECNQALVPEPSASNDVMVAWCRSYLPDGALQQEIEALIHEIACYYGMPGFYWGIWAMIQSELSTIHFDFARYSEQRLREYWLWKNRFEGALMGRTSGETFRTGTEDCAEKAI